MTKFIILAVVIIIALAFMMMYNKLVRLRNNVEEGYSTMDVYLKKRFDLVPNLVETVKGYAKHESETLEKVIQARNAIQSASGTEEKLQGENMLTNSLRSVFALSESYPDLKANQNFVDLQQQLKSIENDIANSRKYYNAVVKEYNNGTQQFPSSILAGMFHFEKKFMFEVSDAQERENVSVKFS